MRVDKYSIFVSLKRTWAVQLAEALKLASLNEEAAREVEPKKVLPEKKKLPNSLNVNYLPKNRPRQLSLEMVASKKKLKSFLHK